MKKFISSVLVVVLLFNFIYCNWNRVYADGAEGEDDSSMQQTMTEDPAEPSNTIAGDVMEEGEVSRVKGGTEKTTTSAGSAGVSAIGLVTGLIALLLDIAIAFPVDILLGQLTYTTEYRVSNSRTEELQYFLSLERIVYNRIPLFDINYFNIKTDSEISSGATYTVGSKGSAYEREIKISGTINDIKKRVSFLYQICRILALIIGLFVLIYIGIRMAISTTVSEKTEYKRMFMAWLESMILIFTMVYIMTAMINLGNSLINLFYNIEQGMLAGGDCFEKNIRDQIFEQLFSVNGMGLTLWSIMYWCLLVIEIKFLWLYLKRVLMVGFLVVISPLITITYAIDKAGDGKAQAFTTWFKEFTVNVLIQPLHAIVYLVFILTANEIATKSPLLALAFLLALGSVEKMVKLIFNLKDLVTLKEVNDFMKKGK